MKVPELKMQLSSDVSKLITDIIKDLGLTYSEWNSLPEEDKINQIVGKLLV